MIEFKLRSITYRLDFSFFLLWCVVYLLGKERLILPTFVACFVHELGHIFTMVLSGRRVKCVEFSGVGIKIVPQYGKMLSKRWDFAIIVSGCISNFLLSGMVLLLKIYPLYDLAYVSLSLGIFNALPIKSLDGYDLLQLISNK